MGDYHSNKTTLCGECGKKLTFDDHGSLVRNPRSEKVKHFESDGLKFECPNCDTDNWLCPLCSDPEDPAPSGWFSTEDSGQIACHNCNIEEVSVG